MDIWASGLEDPPMCSTTIYDIELGKPFVVLQGRNSVRKTDATGGRGIGKKLMVSCNGRHRGHTSMRKHAHLPLVTKATGLSLIHISEPTRLRRISYAVFCLKK